MALAALRHLSRSSTENATALVLERTPALGRILTISTICLGVIVTSACVDVGAAHIAGRRLGDQPQVRLQRLP